MFSSLKIRFWRGVNKLLVRRLPTTALGLQQVPGVVEWEILGQGDGAWAIPKGWLDVTSVCYLFGVGVDVSFDLELHERFACPVFSFDPTPSSVRYMNSLVTFPGRFLPWGIWKQDDKMTLFPQEQGNDVNLSSVDPQRGDAVCEIPCFRLKTIMEKLGHAKIDLLKIDIEGAWLDVIEDMVASGIAPAILCVEFDSPTTVTRVRRAARALTSMGMLFVCRHRDDYLFVNSIDYEARAQAGKRDVADVDSQVEPRIDQEGGAEPNGT